MTESRTEAWFYHIRRQTAKPETNRVYRSNSEELNLSGCDLRVPSQ